MTASCQQGLCLTGLFEILYTITEYAKCTSVVIMKLLLWLHISGIRGETIYRNIAILQYSLLQYNTIWPIENIDILYIAIYCNILLDIVLFVAD